MMDFDFYFFHLPHIKVMSQNDVVNISSTLSFSFVYFSLSLSTMINDDKILNFAMILSHVLDVNFKRQSRVIMLTGTKNKVDKKLLTKTIFYVESF